MKRCILVTWFGLLIGLTSVASVNAQLGSADKDLVFTPVAACRIADTRLSGGALAANTTRAFDVTAVSNFSFQGGEATNCSIAAAGSFSAVAANITVINPNVSGTLKAFAFGATVPIAAVTMNYAAGEVRTSFTIVKLDQSAAANEMTLLSSAQAHVTIDVVGYFSAPSALPTFQCVETAEESTVVAPGANGNAFAPNCASGYLATSTNCKTSSWLTPLVWAGGGACSTRNNSGSNATVTASRTCCRMQ